MRRLLSIVLIAVLTISILLLAGCKQKRTMISDILEKRDKYFDKEVIVAGRVTKTYGVNLFIAEAGAYELDDGSGKVWVITKVGTPQEGDEVGLKGIVSGGVKLGGETFGAVIRERERRSR